MADEQTTIMNEVEADHECGQKTPGSLGFRRPKPWLSGLGIRLTGRLRVMSAQFREAFILGTEKSSICSYL